MAYRLDGGLSDAGHPWLVGILEAGEASWCPGRNAVAASAYVLPFVGFLLVACEESEALVEAPVFVPGLSGLPSAFAPAPSPDLLDSLDSDAAPWAPFFA